MEKFGGIGDSLQFAKLKLLSLETISNFAMAISNFAKLNRKFGEFGDNLQFLQTH